MAELVAVLVPVMRRPQNAAPFMESLQASTDRATVYPICDEDAGDDASWRAWESAGAEVLASQRGGWEWFAQTAGTFAQKVNAGYRRTREPWLLLAGDDVRFHPGWLDEALRVADETGAHVVGTNDLGNARVLAGEHATHMLIRRSYVDVQGASWDGPGVVCHEGFRHWYVDDEIVTAAKQRGVWAPALGSIVEHFHPVWGLAPDDDVYRLGRSHAATDAALFERRRAVYAG